MVRVILFFIMTFTCYVINSNAQEKRVKLKEYIDKEIRIIDNFSGQSITLIKEYKEYYVIRKFFGSGIPIIGTLKYKVKFNNDYQITFSEILDISYDYDKIIKNEEFILSVGENGLDLYLNR